MTKLEHKDGATVKLGFTYALTAGGQITRITHQDSTYWSYGNDLRGRLTKAERYTAGNALQLKETYSYDAGDNLLTKVQYDQRPAPAVTKNTWYRYNTGNELTKMSTAGVDTNMTYDDWGRLITKAQGAYTATYLWRYGGKLKGVTTNFPGETTTQYLFDGLGKRRHKIVQPDPGNSATWVDTAYRWDAGWNILGEYDQGSDASTWFDLGARNKTLVHAGMMTLAEIDGANPSTGTTRYYAHDDLGSARALYSSAKAELGTTEYNPYGDTYASTGTQPAYSFTGKPYDASISMFYFPYRYYSPEMDRWISRDPLGMVDGPNLYQYTFGAPIRYGDFWGLYTVEEIDGISLGELAPPPRPIDSPFLHWDLAVVPLDWLYATTEEALEAAAASAIGLYVSELAAGVKAGCTLGRIPHKGMGPHIHYGPYWPGSTHPKFHFGPKIPRGFPGRWPGWWEWLKGRMPWRWY